jgi:amino acid transporter
MSSTLAVTLATANVSTRMWYSMGRNGAFPKLFAKVHPVYKTPTNAIFAQMILTLGSGLIAGAIWNSQVAFFLLSGLVLVIGVAFVYLMANVGVIVYYWRERRNEFNWLWHFILPVVSSVVLLYALAESYPPFCPAVNCPVDPYLKAPLADIGWLVVGVLILVYYTFSRREAWLKTAGAALGESEDDMAMAKVAPAGASAKI